jgi:hypothetical protein
LSQLETDSVAKEGSPAAAEAFLSASAIPDVKSLDELEADFNSHKVPIL